MSDDIKLPAPAGLLAHEDGSGFVDCWTGDQMHAYAEQARAAERERWAERDDMHTQSSRIYARLASAVRAGADDAALAKMLRNEVSSRA